MRVKNYKGTLLLSRIPTYSAQGLHSKEQNNEFNDGWSKDTAMYEEQLSTESFYTLTLCLSKLRSEDGTVETVKKNWGATCQKWKCYKSVIKHH